MTSETETVPVTQKETSSAATQIMTEDNTVSYDDLVVDLNTAGEDELCRLDGIGPVKARAIISYREENGPFRSADEIMKVPGIGSETYAVIAEHIYAWAPEPATEAETETITETETNGAETEPSTEHEPTLEEIAPIDLNKATKEELMLLPHVDEAAADKIIYLREGMGGFRSTYELLYVDELTQKQVAEIQEFVTVGQ